MSSSPPETLALFALWLSVLPAAGERSGMEALPFARQSQIIEEDMDAQMKKMRPLLEDLERRAASYEDAADPMQRFQGRVELREEVRQKYGSYMELENDYHAYSREFSKQQALAGVESLLGGGRIMAEHGAAARKILTGDHTIRSALRKFKIRVDEALEDEQTAYDAALRGIARRRAQRRRNALLIGALFVLASAGYSYARGSMRRPSSS